METLTYRYYRVSPGVYAVTGADGHIVYAWAHTVAEALRHAFHLAYYTARRTGMPVRVRGRRRG